MKTYAAQRAYLALYGQTKSLFQKWNTHIAHQRCRFDLKRTVVPLYLYTRSILAFALLLQGFSSEVDMPINKVTH